MNNINQLLIVTLFGSMLLNAQDNAFNDQHKINKSYIQSRAKHVSHRASNNATYIEINGKKELKEAIENGELHKTYKEKGDKHIVIKIKNIHLTKKEIKELDGVIGSTVENNGKVKQVISIDRVRLDTDEPITIGVETASSTVDSITSVTIITNSHIGGD